MDGGRACFHTDGFPRALLAHTRVRVCAGKAEPRPRRHVPLLINTTLSLQIHELLQHYEESKPAPVQDGAAALVNEVSLDPINLFITLKLEETRL